MTAVLVLTLVCMVLFIKLKTERDVSEILKARIVGRLIQCN